MIGNRKTQGEWKIQLTMAINFFSPKDSEEIHTRHYQSDDMEILIGNETIQNVGKLLQRYQEMLEQPMKGSEFVYDGVDVLHYKFHRISLNRGVLYMHQ